MYGEGIECMDQVYNVLRRYRMYGEGIECMEKV